MPENARCGRCDRVIDPDGSWENQWPLYGTIDLGFPAQAFGALCGAKCCAETNHFAWWREGYPAMTTNEAQRVTFMWKSDSKWRLCRSCQRELLSVIGRFFHIPERAEQLSKESANAR